MMNSKMMGRVCIYQRFICIWGFLLLVLTAYIQTAPLRNTLNRDEVLNIFSRILEIPENGELEFHENRDEDENDLVELDASDQEESVEQNSDYGEIESDESGDDKNSPVVDLDNREQEELVDINSDYDELDENGNDNGNEDEDATVKLNARDKEEPDRGKILTGNKLGEETITGNVKNNSNTVLHTFVAGGNLVDGKNGSVEDAESKGTKPASNNQGNAIFPKSKNMGHTVGKSEGGEKDWGNAATDNSTLTSIAPSNNNKGKQTIPKSSTKDTAGNNGTKSAMKKISINTNSKSKNTIADNDDNNQDSRKQKHSKICT